MCTPSPESLKRLEGELKGELRTDDTQRILYATDASVYRELPLAVAYPKDESDIVRLIRFAREHQTSLIPRTAGTSLAGQVVGPGIVVDVSRHFTQILEIDAIKARVRVQPGVVRNELNLALARHGLFFAPETSTQNRAMIGGMVGNNACGANSLVYGTTRDHLISVRALLSDGSVAQFGAVLPADLERLYAGTGLEGRIYRNLCDMLVEPGAREEIEAEFPRRTIHRRNMGYALDLLADCEPFNLRGPALNLCRLIAGSEGTLAFLTEITLNCVPLPRGETILVCVHCTDVDEALRANLVALRHSPQSSELLDRHILDCTKANPEQARNRFFVMGDPGAILVVELLGKDNAEAKHLAGHLVSDLKAAGLGFHYSAVTGGAQTSVWNLRKAGLGLQSNVPGDAKPVSMIEDTAVDPSDLPAFIRDVDRILACRGLSAVHYAHAGSGELHLRPILDLKSLEGQRLFREIATEVAHLVKRYRGSLSGEHGDGRVRGEFLPLMVGSRNYERFRSIKATWDPDGIFNPGKITATRPMDKDLRYEVGQETREFATVFNFSAYNGILRAAEQCNGSGDCRKSYLMGGTMCPSFMATRREEDTTRARANMLREVLTRSSRANPFDSDQIAAVMDLCLSCKGCKSECPSNVDMARLKAEWQQQFYDARGLPLRARLIGNIDRIARWGSMAPNIHNFVLGNRTISWAIKRISGIAPERSLPLLHSTTVRRWHRRYGNRSGSFLNGRVHLFCDEFTDFYDSNVGIKAIGLLNRLGYEVIIPEQTASGRAQISKGLLRAARRMAILNVELLSKVVSDNAPLVGIEPSALLGFRDEYPDLMPADLVATAKNLASHCLLIDEFVSQEFDKGRILRSAFTVDAKIIHLHGHCHQKALASLAPTVKALELPANYRVCVIPSGCCGMAGSFGYEREHFAVSQQIGELVLFPAIRQLSNEVMIAAPGTSCRHQIRDGTGRQALHPAEILYDALAGPH